MPGIATLPGTLATPCKQNRDGPCPHGTYVHEAEGESQLASKKPWHVRWCRVPRKIQQWAHGWLSPLSI